MLNGEDGYVNDLGEPRVDGTVQPDEVLVNGDVNAGGEVNPETGELIQDERPADENEEDLAKFNFTPVTVSAW